MATMPTSVPASLTNWISQWLTKKFGEKLGAYNVTPMTGDGSNRKFYRLDIPRSNPEIDSHERYVVLHDPPWTFTKDYAVHQTYLREKHLPVPNFLVEDAENGILVMEDLGDKLLQQHIQDHPHEKMPWLYATTKLLAQIHGKTFPVPRNLPAAKRCFDTQKYAEELLFTLEHLHEKLLELPLEKTKAEEVIFKFSALLSEFQPNAFVHRDFHTRNLMLKAESLYIIDFQDARLGSPLYDLASLLYDPYVSISPSERKELVHEYEEAIKTFPIAGKINWQSFEDQLELLAYQRLLKAAGSFASFFTRFQKQTHLAYLIPCLENALLVQTKATEKLSALKSTFPIDTWISQIHKRRGEAWKLPKTAQ